MTPEALLSKHGCYESSTCHNFSTDDVGLTYSRVGQIVFCIEATWMNCTKWPIGEPERHPAKKLLATFGCLWQEIYLLRRLTDHVMHQSQSETMKLVTTDWSLNHTPCRILYLKLCSLFQLISAFRLQRPLGISEPPSQTGDQTHSWPGRRTLTFLRPFVTGSYLNGI